VKTTPPLWPSVLLILFVAIPLSTCTQNQVQQQDGGEDLVKAEAPQTSTMEELRGLEKDIYLLLKLYDRNIEALRACQQRNKKLAKDRLRYKKMAEQAMCYRDLSECKTEPCVSCDPNSGRIP
jgi:hypothetical protein